MYRSTKTYGHEIGLSCCFRQWRADSHCRLLHGYAIGVRIEFEATELDHRNWVVDFGGLKSLKDDLCNTFDHTLLVARDDPNLNDLLVLKHKGLADVVILDRVGCESFAEHIFQMADAWLELHHHKPRVRVFSVEVKEHGANSAIYTRG